jgi:hypothetical protein
LYDIQHDHAIKSRDSLNPKADVHRGTTVLARLVEVMLSITVGPTRYAHFMRTMHVAYVRRLVGSPFASRQHGSGFLALALGFLLPNEKVEQLAANRLTTPQDAIASLLQRLVLPALVSYVLDRHIGKATLRLA